MRFERFGFGWRAGSGAEAKKERRRGKGSVESKAALWQDLSLRALCRVNVIIVCSMWIRSYSRRCSRAGPTRYQSKLLFISFF